jgi:hypothetical protein
MHPDFFRRWKRSEFFNTNLVYFTTFHDVANETMIISAGELKRTAELIVF